MDHLTARADCVAGRRSDGPNQGLKERAALREWLIERGTEPVIPPRKNKIPDDYDRGIYMQRNVVERMLSCFKDWRRITTRFDTTSKVHNRRQPCSNRHLMAVASPTPRLRLPGDR